MRWCRPAGIRVLSIHLLASLLMLMTPVMSVESKQLGTSDREAQQVLARARTWAEAEGATAVRSLSLHGTQGPRGQAARKYDVSLMLPDRCQIRQDVGWVHTWTEGGFWMTVAPGSESSFSVSARATAERTTRQKCVEFMVAFLMRPPNGLGVTVASVGRVPLAGSLGDGVRVWLPGEAGRVFVFDSVSGRPMGFVTFSPESPTGSADLHYVLFAEHQAVSGYRVPSRLTLHFPSQRAIVDWTVVEARVNDVSADLFDAGRTVDLGMATSSHRRR